MADGHELSDDAKANRSLVGADSPPPSQSLPWPPAGRTTKVAWTRPRLSESLVERATALRNRWSPLVPCLTRAQGARPSRRGRGGTGTCRGCAPLPRPRSPGTQAPGERDLGNAPVAT